ncbi:DUF4129 domain-containing protein [uncultured Serinicoccus sp.]|uniref:DUF4129 domain-containing protein n=1 Tax=uncultured Serinicoccus sp. TaxID=735514 RepID=UPI0026366800|nr:DUF4129 domain-containing protein [uncultured Serinicoccus sp.]
MRRGTGSTSGVVLAVLAALAGLSLLLWSSSSGRPLLGPPTGTWEPEIGLPPLPPVAEQTAATAVPTESRPPPQDGWQVDWLLVGALLLVVVVVLLIVRALLARDRDGDEPLGMEEDEQLAALLEASGDDVRYRALAEGDPRNAVVACWVALEEAVRRSGLPDNPAETASELTRRVLSRWEVDETSIRTLSEAYREARFSRHPVSEQQREQAVAALDRIHEGLRRRALAEQARADRAAAARAPSQGEGEAR